MPAADDTGVVADDPTDGTCSLTSPNARQDPVASRRHDVRAVLAVRRDVNPGTDIDLCVFNSASSTCRRQRSGHVGRGGQPAQPGGRRLHGRRAGLGRGRLFAVQAVHTWLLGSDRSRQHDGHRAGDGDAGRDRYDQLTFSGLAPENEVPRLGRLRRIAGLPNPTIVRAAETRPLASLDA